MSPVALIAVAVILPALVVAGVVWWGKRMRQRGGSDSPSPRSPGGFFATARGIALASDLSALGSSTLISVFAGIGVLAFVAAGYPIDAIALGGAALAAGLAGVELKRVTGRARPKDPSSAFFGSSFPSSHTLMATTFYALAAALLVPFIPAMPIRIVIIAATVGILAAVGLSRVLLRVHFPSDVYAGAVCGLTFTVSALLFRYAVSDL